MQIITTSAPIPILDIKRKYTEDVHFEIDYALSKFKGKAFLTYLGNLNIDADLLVSTEEDMVELVASYLVLPVMFYNQSLVGIVANLLLIRNGMLGSVPFDPDQFFADHGDKLDLWQDRLDMLPLYAARCLMGENFAVEPGQFPGVDETAQGINWIHCIKHPGMALYFSLGRPLRYSKYWFDEPTFAGRNLYTHFESPDNVLFVSAGTLHLPEMQEEFKTLVAEHDQDYARLIQG